MKRIIVYLVCLGFLIPAVLAFAELKSFIKEYTHQASELDSKTTCRVIALEQVKRELLEELGTYVQATTVVKDYQIEKDEIRTLTAGIVQTKVIDDRWTGKEYWLKAQVSADPDEVAASIEKLKNDDQLAQELAEANAEKEAALKEVERLKAELAKSDADKEQQEKYNQAVNDLEASDSFEQGTALNISGNYEEAAVAYDRAIRLRPNNAKAYFNRSVVFMNMGDSGRAEVDIDRAMQLRPNNVNGYYRRAVVYRNIRQARMANLKQPPRQGNQQDDAMQRFLEKKRIQHKLAQVSPQERRPFVRENNKRFNAAPSRLENKQRPLPGQRKEVTRPGINRPIAPELRNDQPGKRNMAPVRPGINRPLAKPGPQPPRQQNLRTDQKKNLKNKQREGHDEEEKRPQRLPAR